MPVQGRDQAVSDVIDHDIAAERAEGELVRVGASNHAGDCASLAAEKVLLVDYVALGPEVMHEEVPSLRCTTE